MINERFFCSMMLCLQNQELECKITFHSQLIHWHFIHICSGDHSNNNYYYSALLQYSHHIQQCYLKRGFHYYYLKGLYYSEFWEDNDGWLLAIQQHLKSFTLGEHFFFQRNELIEGEVEEWSTFNASSSFLSMTCKINAAITLNPWQYPTALLRLA